MNYYEHHIGKESEMTTGLPAELNGGAASTAEQNFSMERLGSEDLLERHFSPFVETALTEITRRLRADWLTSCARLWGDLADISKITATKGSGRDKFVVFFLRDGFLQFSQFLCLFEYLFLQGEYRRLSVDELVSELEKGRNRYLGEAGRSYRFNYSDGAADSGQDACSGCGDSGRVHF